MIVEERNGDKLSTLTEYIEKGLRYLGKAMQCAEELEQMSGGMGERMHQGGYPGGMGERGGNYRYPMGMRENDDEMQYPMGERRGRDSMGRYTRY